MEYKFVLMTEPAQKCEYIDIFKQNYSLKLFTAVKIPYSWCFISAQGEIYIFLQKQFYNIDYRSCRPIDRNFSVADPEGLFDWDTKSGSKLKSIFQIIYDRNLQL